MSKIPNIKISDYDYHLPKKLIPEYPTVLREVSKLLYSDIMQKNINHYIFKDITTLIPSDSLLIINSTKVIAARLLMQKPSSGKCELLLTEPVFPSFDPVLIMSTKGKCRWNCIIGGRNVKVGLKLTFFTKNYFQFESLVISRTNNYGEIEFTWNEKFSFAEVIAELGKIPLPPYIERDTEQLDIERYQTVYARQDGSVAAPTAGLHFTDEIFDELKNKNIKISELTLHVGPGTFLPVSSDNVNQHQMHNERIYINKSTILAIIKNLRENNNIIAVGTTSVRTIETLYWIGLKSILDIDKNIDNFELEQEEPYLYSEQSETISPMDSYNEILNYMESKNIDFITGKTKLFIMPGYKYRLINGIITNFHLPKSTLLLLIAAFAGIEFWKTIYNEALDNNYRFLSYGDSSFLFLPK